MEKISVVLCTCNGERYIREQLDTVLTQTRPADEIIIQDDHSTDGTWQILTDYAARFPAIHLFRNEARKGVNANFISAMHRATGDLLALCDQDDRWEADKLEAQAAALGNCWLCSCLSEPFSDDGFPVSRDVRQPNFHLLRVLFLGVLPGHTLLLRRELVGLLPPVDNCPYLYDWQLQTLAAAAESIVFVPRVLVHFRRHANAFTATLPGANRLLSSSGLRYVWVCLRYHRQLQGCVRERLGVARRLFMHLPVKTQTLKLGLELIDVQSRYGFASFLARTAFALRHRRLLFHAQEPDSLRLWLRALFYPFSCGYYYRGILTDPSKK